MFNFSVTMIPFIKGTYQSTISDALVDDTIVAQDLFENSERGG